MNDFKKMMLRLFLTHPIDFNIYLDGFKNKPYSYRLIQSFLPTDSGIEFEIGHQMVDRIRDVKINHPRAYPRLCIDSDFEVTFRVGKKDMIPCINELYRFYNMITKPYLNDRRAQECGIHIHTNLMTNFNYRKLLSNENINEIVRMIEIHFKYTGTYNRGQFSTHKGYSVVYRACYNTIEYRCIPMTWSFKELLKHMIFCHVMTKGFQMYSKGQCDIDRIKEMYWDWHKTLNLI